jgi:hypothetical protein
MPDLKLFICREVESRSQPWRSPSESSALVDPGDTGPALLTGAHGADYSRCACSRYSLIIAPVSG